MSNLFYTSPTDVAAVTKALSETVNNLDAAIDTAFDKLPTEANLKRGTTQYAVDTGTANAYLVALPHTPSGYVDGLTIKFRPLNTNTTAATVNVSSLGVKSLRRDDGTACVANDIIVGIPISATYSTNTGYFHITGNSATAVAAALASQVAAAVSESNASSSASSASGSASSASSSASTATTQASNASTSASNALTSENNAETAETNASNSATTSTNYATKVDGYAAATDNSAKSWAVGGTSTGQPSAGDAKSWATKATTAVAGSDYSAKEYAAGDATASGGSAKAWATDASSPDGTTTKSALTWAGEAAASASDTAAIVADAGWIAVAADLVGADTIGDVAAIAANVTTVAGISANVTTVAGISANVTTVAGISANVTSVAGNETNINLVAGDAVDIGTVATANAAIGTVSTNIASVNTVSGISANVTTVASVSADVTTVAGIAADVAAVENIAANVTTVAGVAANVTTVAGISANVTTVAGNTTNINTVAGVSADVSAVAAQFIGWNFSTTTTMADPGSGIMRFNNAALASVTAIAFDDNNSAAAGVSAYVLTWDDSTSAVKGTLTIRQGTANFAVFDVTGLTDNAGWTQVTVAHVTSNGTFTNAVLTFVDFDRTGNVGAGIAEQAVGFTLTGGTTPKTLTVALDASVSGTNTGDNTLGANVATFLATPTLANLNSAVSDADVAILGANTFTADQTMPSLGETTPGTVRGTNKEIFKTASADSPLTAAECSGTIVSNYGMTDADMTIDLPTAAAGLSFLAILPAVRARFVKFHCPTAQADKIYLLGVAGADDGNVGVASGYATGSACSFFCFQTGAGAFDWFAIPIFGTWVAS